MLTGADLRRLTCALLDFVVRSSTRLICGMRGWAVLFWPEAHREAPICAGVFYRSQSSPSPNLPDTNLEDAEGLRQAQVDRAHLNIGTELPEGLTEPEYAK